ncbi:hypothetical protein [Streptomyces aureoversilis]|uniref:Uncharacterized protein n=1 Tax=Streptomyces aureoversilis TaxID=67277 RepID=A0ABW0A813_9ACTN
MVTVRFTVCPGPTEGTDSFTVCSASPESDVNVKVTVYVKGSLLWLVTSNPAQGRAPGLTPVIFTPPLPGSPAALPGAAGEPGAEASPDARSPHEGSPEEPGEPEPDPGVRAGPPSPDPAT